MECNYLPSTSIKNMLKILKIKDYNQLFQNLKINESLLDENFKVLEGSILLMEKDVKLFKICCTELFMGFQECLSECKDIWVHNFALKNDKIENMSFFKTYSYILRNMIKTYEIAINTHTNCEFKTIFNLVKSVVCIFNLIQDQSNDQVIITDIIICLNKLIGIITKNCSLSVAINHNHKALYGELFSEEISYSNLYFFFETSENILNCAYFDQQSIKNMNTENLINIQRILFELNAFHSSQDISYSQYFIEYYNKHFENILSFDHIKITPRHIDIFIKSLWQILNKADTIKDPYAIYVQTIFPRLLSIAQGSPDPKAILGFLHLNDQLLGFKCVRDEPLETCKNRALQTIYKSVCGLELDNSMSEVESRNHSPTQPPNLPAVYGAWLESHLNYHLTKLHVNESLLAIQALLPCSDKMLERNFFALLPKLLPLNSASAALVDHIMADCIDALGRQRRLTPMLERLCQALASATRSNARTLLGVLSVERLARNLKNLPYQAYLRCLRTCLTYIQKDPSNYFYARLTSICLRNFAFDKTSFSQTLKQEANQVLEDIFGWLIKFNLEDKSNGTFHNLCQVFHSVLLIGELMSTYNVPHLGETLKIRLESLPEAISKNPFWNTSQVGHFDEISDFDANLHKINLAMCLLRLLPQSQELDVIADSLAKSLSNAHSCLQSQPDSLPLTTHVHVVDKVAFMFEVKVFLAMAELKKGAILSDTVKDEILNVLSGLIIEWVVRQEGGSSPQTFNQLVKATTARSPTFHRYLIYQGWSFVLNRLNLKPPTSCETTIAGPDSGLSSVLALLNLASPGKKWGKNENLPETLKSILEIQGDNFLNGNNTTQMYCSALESFNIWQDLVGLDSPSMRCLSFLCSLPDHSSLTLHSVLAFSSLILDHTIRQKSGTVIPEKLVEILYKLWLPHLNSINFPKIPLTFMLSLYLTFKSQQATSETSNWTNRFTSFLAQSISEQTREISEFLRFITHLESPAFSTNLSVVVELLSYSYEKIKVFYSHSVDPQFIQQFTKLIARLMTQLKASTLDRVSVLRLALLSHNLAVLSTGPDNEELNGVGKELLTIFANQPIDRGINVPVKELSLTLGCLLSLPVEPHFGGQKRKWDYDDVVTPKRKVKFPQNSDFNRKFCLALDILDDVLLEEMRHNPSSILTAVYGNAPGFGPLHTGLKLLSKIILELPIDDLCSALANYNLCLERSVMDENQDCELDNVILQFSLCFLVLKLAYVRAGLAGDHAIGKLYKLYIKTLDMWSTISPQLVPSNNLSKEDSRLLVIATLAIFELFRAVIKYTNKFGETFSAALLSFDTLSLPLLKHYRHLIAPDYPNTVESVTISQDGDDSFYRLAYISIINTNLSLWSYCVAKKPKAILSSGTAGSQFLGLAQALARLCAEILNAPLPVALQVCTAFSKTLSVCSRTFRDHHTDAGVSATRLHILPHAFAVLLGPISAYNGLNNGSPSDEIDRPVVIGTVKRILRGALIEIMGNIDKTSFLYLQAILNNPKGRGGEGGGPEYCSVASNYFNHLYNDFLKYHKYDGKN